MLFIHLLHDDGVNFYKIPNRDLMKTFRWIDKTYHNPVINVDSRKLFHSSEYIHLILEKSHDCNK